MNVWKCIRLINWGPVDWDGTYILQQSVYMVHVRVVDEVALHCATIEQFQSLYDIQYATTYM